MCSSYKPDDVEVAISGVDHLHDIDAIIEGAGWGALPEIETVVPGYRR